MSSDLTPVMPLTAVLSTHELSQRTARPPDLAGENRAMLELARYLAERPTDILQKLSEVAHELCRAGSAGISIIDYESDVFRWHGLAGALAELRWSTLPRFFSPCGVVVDSAAVQLMTMPERHFDYIAQIKPTVAEVLLVPFSVDGKIVGTVWVVMHDGHSHFDSEDVRIIANLAAFAAAGFKILEAQKSLETSIRNRDEFLAILGHELRNPLSPMVSAHRLLSLPQLDDKTRWTAVDVIGRQLGHMQRLVNDILDLSRIAEGKLAVTKVPVEINALVSEAVQTVTPKAEQAGISLTVTPLTQAVHANADPGRLLQVVNNLLNNAIKFTPAGGRIAVDVLSSKGQVCIAVKDSGIGLAPESIVAIFSMFSQVDSRSKNNKGGLGIGLNLAKTLVELHDGSISARSAGLNQGCEFTIRLPVIAAAVDSASEQPALPADASPSALRILIADDNQDAADSLQMLLGMKGYKAHIAYDGLEAVSQALALRPHVALIDLTLPGCNGFEVVEQLRKHPATKHSLLVAVTGHATSSDRTRTREAGFDVHMAKPVEPEELFALLAATTAYDGAERRSVIERVAFPERRRQAR